MCVGRAAQAYSQWYTILLVAVLLVGPSAVGADQVPPDWESNYQGTALELWSTGGPETVDLGFDFHFYGQSYSNAGIAANGYLGMGTTGPWNSDYTPEQWPTDNWASEIVSAMWTDFNPDGLSSVDTYYRTLGTAGDRRFVATWEATPDADGNLNTLQIQLHESDDRIQMSYLSLPLDPPDPAVHTTPVGVNYGDGVKHTSFNYDAEGNGNGPDGSLEGKTLWFDYNDETESYDYTSEQVPEPGTLILLLSGLGIGEIMRRRRN